MKSCALIVLLALVGCDRKQQEASPTKWSSTTMMNEASWRDVFALECRPTTFNYCTEESCKANKPAITIRWEPKGSYQRCDKKGCSNFYPKVSYSGIWTNLSMPEHGMFMKVNSDGQYAEVVSLNDDIYVYHGECRQVKAH